jgi:hypothetical protein
LKLRDLHPKRFFIDTWHALDAERFEPGDTPQFERRGNPGLVAYIYSVVTVSIILQEYIGTTPFFLNIVNFIDTPGSAVSSPLLYHAMGWFRPETGTLRAWLITSGNYELFALCYWASWRVLGFLIIPLIAAYLHPTLRKSSLGFTFQGMKNHLWVYGVLFLPVFVAVVIVSFFDEFQEYYPFYSKAHETLKDFIIWESFYIAQFFSLEFFFRGFMLQPLRRELGSGAIFAMMIPYVMIHIGKPMAECFAAILAGIVLGTLAMRTRSIWSGFLIHVSVALSMDLLSIWQKL